MISALPAILEKAQSGSRIDENEALRLLNVRGADLHTVFAVADTVRQKRVGDDVSYIINRNINFTNICIGSCGFCAFSVRQDDPKAYFLPVDEIVKRAEEARKSVLLKSDFSVVFTQRLTVTHTLKSCKPSRLLYLTFTYTHYRHQKSHTARISWVFPISKCSKCSNGRASIRCRVLQLRFS